MRFANFSLDKHPLALMNVKPADRVNAITPFYVMELLRQARIMETAGRRVIHMEIGEPDFPTPKAIINAALKHIETGQVKYTPAAGLPELRQKIAGFYRQRYGVDIDPRRILITPGASGAFLLAFGISLNPGDTIMMADPCYPCNRNFASLFGGHAMTLPVSAENQYQLTAGQIRLHWGETCTGVLVASPANPTGTLIADEQLAQAVAATEELGGIFFSDEIYHGLTYGRPAVSALQFSDQVFVVNSFSKYFGMTGWRIGWLVVPEPWVGAAEKLAQNIFIATSTHSQFAALSAFEPETLAELELRRKQLARRRDYLYQQLLRLGFKIPIKPEGAFYIYADGSNFTHDSFQFAWDLLDKEAVAVTPGKDFGVHDAQYALRFAYTTSMANLAEAVRRLERFVS